MNKELIAAAFGLVVAVIGAIMIRTHRRAWDMQKHDAALPDDDRLHFAKRYRRRMQTSSSVVVLGLLLALGGLMPWGQFPLAFACYWGGVLLLTAWVILQALGDMLSTGARAKVSLAEVRQKQRELERQLEVYKSRRSNGRHEE